MTERISRHRGQARDGESPRHAQEAGVLSTVSRARSEEVAAMVKDFS